MAVPSPQMSCTPPALCRLKPADEPAFNPPHTLMSSNKVSGNLSICKMQFFRKGILLCDLFQHWHRALKLFGAKLSFDPSLLATRSILGNVLLGDPDKENCELLWLS